MRSSARPLANAINSAPTSALNGCEASTRRPLSSIDSMHTSLAAEPGRVPHSQADMHKKSKTPFNWSDPFLLDQQLTHDERMVRDTARAYCQDKLLPRALDMFRHEKADPSI